MSKLPKISQTPPVAAEEGFLTETEKKRNNMQKRVRGGGQKIKGSGRKE